MGRASKTLMTVNALDLYSRLVHSESHTYDTLFLIYENPLKPNIAKRIQ